MFNNMYVLLIKCLTIFSYLGIFKYNSSNVSLLKKIVIYNIRSCPTTISCTQVKKGDVQIYNKIILWMQHPTEC